jgi:hypothetical protein
MLDEVVGEHAAADAGTNDGYVEVVARSHVLRDETLLSHAAGGNQVDVRRGRERHLENRLCIGGGGAIRRRAG